MRTTSSPAGLSKPVRSPEELRQSFIDAHRPGQATRVYFHGRADFDERGQIQRSSGIPIFGTGDAAPRTGWSSGHVQVRNSVSDSLRNQREAQGSDRRISADNSHALGHGDYGVDHLLSAPPASEYQNTEQLGI